MANVSKKLQTEFDQEKEYVFELIQRHSQAQPIDRRTSSPLSNGYSPVYTLPNSGIARDPETGMAREWRLITGQPSIWANEQKTYERADIKDVNRVLSDGANELTFIKGYLRVRGNETLKLRALTLMDEFAGNEEPYNKGKVKIFKLNNPDREAQDLYSQNNNEFKALQAVISMEEEKMLGLAMSFGINIENQTPAGLIHIKNQFFLKAKNDPKAFLKTMDNPKHKINYLVNKGLQEGIISLSQQQNKLTWVDGNVAVLEINPDHPMGPITFVVDKILSKDRAAVSFFKALDDRIGQPTTAVA